MSAKINIAGLRFGRWLVLDQSENTWSRKWNCRCDCGTTRAVNGRALRSGKTKSCGCLAREMMIRHGHASKKTGTYTCWYSMIQRCTNKNYKQFSDYGGRGIGLCDEWRSFACFLADMGERPAGLTLDRIDNSGGYNKQNCRWATRAQQQRNTRRNKFVMIDGRPVMMMDVARGRGLCVTTVRVRLHRGWSMERALEIGDRGRVNHEC